jgi:hypothetical protein
LQHAKPFIYGHFRNGAKLTLCETLLTYQKAVRRCARCVLLGQFGKAARGSYLGEQNIDQAKRLSIPRKEHPIRETANHR